MGGREGEEKEGWNGRGREREAEGRYEEGRGRGRVEWREGGWRQVEEEIELGLKDGWK